MKFWRQVGNDLKKLESEIDNYENRLCEELKVEKDSEHYRQYENVKSQFSRLQESLENLARKEKGKQLDEDKFHDMLYGSLDSLE